MVGFWIGAAMFFFGGVILGLGFIGYHSDVSSARPVLQENKVALRVGGVMFPVGFVVMVCSAILMS